MPDHQSHSRPTRIAVIGNYTPRRCGIATFTTDLAESLATEAPDGEVWAVAMNDTAKGYPYPSHVHFEVDEQSRRDYRLAAEFLDINGTQVASLQHEYGIYGGAAGEFVLDLIGRLRMPVVTTLHTVPKEPTADQIKVTAEIARLSAKLVVMSRKAFGFIRDIYQVPREEIAFVHHRIPDLPFVDPNYYKEQFGVEGRTVAATFGLLWPNKGIEHMITRHAGYRRKIPGVHLPGSGRYPGVRDGSLPPKRTMNARGTCTTSSFPADGSRRATTCSSITVPPRHHRRGDDKSLETTGLVAPAFGDRLVDDHESRA